MEQDVDVDVVVTEVATPPALVMDFRGSIESWEGLDRIAKIIKASGKKLFLVSMKNVDHINCAGLGKIMAMSFIAKELGKQLRFAAMQPIVRQAFESLDGRHSVSVYKCEDDALSAE